MLLGFDTHQVLSTTRPLIFVKIETFVFYSNICIILKQRLRNTFQNVIVKLYHMTKHYLCALQRSLPTFNACDPTGSCTQHS